MDHVCAWIYLYVINRMVHLRGGKFVDDICALKTSSPKKCEGIIFSNFTLLAEKNTQLSDLIAL